MDKITKFLNLLSAKERAVLIKIMEDIKRLYVANYNVKPLKGYHGVYRLKKGNFRIIYYRKDNTGIVVDLDFRKNIYKNM